MLEDLSISMYGSNLRDTLFSYDKYLPNAYSNIWFPIPPDKYVIIIKGIITNRPTCVKLYDTIILTNMLICLYDL